MDFIEWMQDYCDNEREQARNLISYAEKWASRLKQQSSLTSYHTTKRAQLDVVRITKELSRLKENTCTEIQKVIEKYRTYTNDTYITERFRPGRKHRRTTEFKKQFKTAYASLRTVSDELETLRNQENKARDALRTADSACEILELDPTTNDKQRLRANEVQTKRRTQVADIEKKIAEATDRHKAARKTYRTKATEIFKQCQYVEEERLEQMRETLLDFIQAMCTPKYTEELKDVFDGLTKKITTQQNSFDDLLFWARTYGIESKLTKSMTLPAVDNDENETSQVTKKASTRENGRHSSHVEHDIDEGDPSTTPAKAKVKRTRSALNTEKKNDPSNTHHNNVLNQV